MNESNRSKLSGLEKDLILVAFCYPAFLLIGSIIGVFIPIIGQILFTGHTGFARLGILLSFPAFLVAFVLLFVFQKAKLRSLIVIGVSFVFYVIAAAIISVCVDHIAGQVTWHDIRVEVFKDFFIPFSWLWPK